MGYLSNEYLSSAQKGFTGIVERLAKGAKSADANSAALRAEGSETRSRVDSYEPDILPEAVATDITIVGAWMLASTEAQRLLIGFSS